MRPVIVLAFCLKTICSLQGTEGNPTDPSSVTKLKSLKSVFEENKEPRICGIEYWQGQKPYGEHLGICTGIFLECKNANLHTNNVKFH